MSWYNPSDIVNSFKKNPVQSAGFLLGGIPGAIIGNQAGNALGGIGGSPTGVNGSLGWAGAQNYQDLLGPNSDPTGQIFANLKSNNALGTGVGKYLLPYLGLLNNPEFNQLKNFQSDPQFKQMEAAANPNLYMANATPGIDQAIGNAKTGGLRALTRGGLRGSGAEARLYSNLGYQRANAVGQASTAAQNYAGQMAQSVYEARRKGLGDVLNMRQGVLENILKPVAGDKTGSGAQVDWAQGATGIAQLIATIAGASCWVAEELYGVDHPKTHAARFYCLTHDNAFIRNYQKHGRAWAAWLSENTWAKPIVQPIWDRMADLGMKEMRLVQS